MTRARAMDSAEARFIVSGVFARTGIRLLLRYATTISRAEPPK
jgi:hypothetical protein